MATTPQGDDASYGHLRLENVVTLTFTIQYSFCDCRGCDMHQTAGVCWSHPMVCWGENRTCLPQPIYAP
ncbi:hypothetical protein JOB18_014625 [Solea senegalensis]|uniref:Uncharacterized protein n=1 Tax=Solea senegalensis TaxID=28829 RepID=A0AAV6SYE5_SOLSE|nr:hypothetical protein JOB18_014625 [Solea senegalensis]